MVDIDISKFNQLKKNASRSYNQQKALIKKVLAGKPVACEHCQQPLLLQPATDTQAAVIKCAKGCTDIELSIG